MGVVRIGPPTKLIEQLVTEFAIVNFVETGTYHGGTALWASQHFKNVSTIEYSQELYEKAVHKFHHVSNVEFIFGDSRTELRKLVEQLEGSSVFWLDAHWSGGATYGKNDQCPLIEEIKIINSSKSNSFIFIDDARLFTSPPQYPHKIEQWPDITTVISELHSGNSSQYIVIIEDVIISVPILAKATVAQYCQEVNAKAWNEYSQKHKNSNLKKGLKFIYKSLKKSLKLP